RLFEALADLLRERFHLFAKKPKLPPAPKAKAHLLPTDRVGYLGEIVRTIRGYRRRTEEEAERLSRIQALARASDARARANDESDAAAASAVARRLELEKKSAPREAQERLDAGKAELAKYRSDAFRSHRPANQHP